MEIERNRKPVKEISLIPLINVVFMLLVFFMVAGTLEKVDLIPVNLPEAQSGQMLDEGHVQLVLGRYGEMTLNDEPIMLADLKTLMRKQLEFNPKRVITIKADARMDASRLIAVLDDIKAAGGVNLSLITQSL